MMKKLLLSAFVFLLTTPVGAVSAQFKHKNIFADQEFRRIYRKINNVLSLSGTSRCIDDPTFCVDFVNDQVDIDGALTVSGNTTLTGDLAVNGGDMTTSASTFNLFQNLTTLNIGASATTTNLGVSASISVNSSGVVTKPNQSSFLVTAPVSSNDVTGDGTSWTVEHDTEIYDLNSDFNTGTYTFTAPVTGKYLFNAGITFQEQTAAAGHTTAWFHITTSNRNYIAYRGQIIDNYDALYTSVIADMDANDTVTVVFKTNGGTKVVETFDGSGEHNYFSGSLIN